MKERVVCVFDNEISQVFNGVRITQVDSLRLLFALTLDMQQIIMLQNHKVAIIIAQVVAVILKHSQILASIRPIEVLQLGLKYLY